MISEIRLLTAKTSRDDENLWLPLTDHLKDTAGVIENLAKRWLSGSVYYETGISKKEGIKVARLLALVHDLGKSTPAFQQMILEHLSDLKYLQESARMDFTSGSEQNSIKHAHAGAVLLRVMGYPESIAAIVGAHHGKPEAKRLDDDAAAELNAERSKYGARDSVWRQMQTEIAEWALHEAGYSSLEEIPELSETAQMIFCGLLIMADWIASNSYYFPLLSLTDEWKAYDKNRAKHAMKRLELPDGCFMHDYWREDTFFTDRFHFTANSVQKKITEIAAKMEAPGIMILEAPMGEGKTEAALAASEIFMNRFDLKGIAFFLPSQATTNAMFSRITSWLKEQSSEPVSIQLYHSNAELNENFRKLEYGDVCLDDNEEDPLLVHSFFRGRKTKMLSDVVVGTIDQLLMAALKQKHVMLRHLGLAGKMIVIDEVHSYDSYSSVYLERVLQWLGAYRIPVILLSATLPGSKRQAFLQAYAGKKKCRSIPIKETTTYPLISWLDETGIQLTPVLYDKKERIVTIIKGTEESLEMEIASALSEGGCIGIILNTVYRVQKMAEQIQKRFPEAIVEIDHSQLLLPDRLEHEKKILQLVGKHSTEAQRKNVIVIGTQVLEQSLDLDFDFLITDLCPMDLLMQRIGRLHRHIRKRPEKMKMARCIVLNTDTAQLENGAKSIYGEYLLTQTASFLPEKIAIPSDICRLVQKVYCEEEGEKIFPEMYETYRTESRKKQVRAKNYCLEKPETGKFGGSIVGILDAEIGLDDVKARAAVRDGNPSIEVLIMRESVPGFAEIISGDEKGRRFELSEELSTDEGRIISEQRLRLPQRFASPWCIDQIVEELQSQMNLHTNEWTRSPMLAGELILFLDHSNNAELNGFHLHYDNEKGLEWKEDEDRARKRI